MITEIILVLFAILYYLFSTILFATLLFDTLIQDINKSPTGLQVLVMSVMTLIVTPIATPIILGIKLGNGLKIIELWQQ